MVREVQEDLMAQAVRVSHPQQKTRRRLREERIAALKRLGSNVLGVALIVAAIAMLAILNGFAPR